MISPNQQLRRIYPWQIILIKARFGSQGIFFWSTRAKCNGFKRKQIISWNGLSLRLSGRGPWAHHYSQACFLVFRFIKALPASLSHKFLQQPLAWPYPHPKKLVLFQDPCSGASIGQQSISPRWAHLGWVGAWGSSSETHPCPLPPYSPQIITECLCYLLTFVYKHKWEITS